MNDRFERLLTGVQDLAALIKGSFGSGSGIVYCHKRKTCDWVAGELGDAGIDAATYHAGKLSTPHNGS